MSNLPCSPVHTVVLALYAEGAGIVADHEKAARALRKLNNAALKAAFGEVPAQLGRLKGFTDQAKAALPTLSPADMAALALAFEKECQQMPVPSAQDEWPLLCAIKFYALRESKGVVTPNFFLV